MKKELNAQWALALAQMQPLWEDHVSVTREKVKRMAEYVKGESDGAFAYDKHSGYLLQRKELPWRYLFDVIKAASTFGFIVLMELPKSFGVRKPEPARGTMYAYYNADSDAVLLQVYTGEYREDLSGYDGFGREPDELEVVEGLRRCNGSWAEELHLKWI